MLSAPGWTRWARATLLLGLTSCGSEEASEFDFETGPTMLPGDDCLRCHSQGSAYPTAPHWSLAGTVYPSPDAPATTGVNGAEVVITSEDGEMVELLVTNSAGNFYSNTPLPAGFRVAVRHQGASVEMPCPPPAGNCGACHSLPPIGGPSGRIAVPQGAPAAVGTFDCTTWTRR
jgi:hypothetical protein